MHPVKLAETTTKRRISDRYLNKDVNNVMEEKKEASLSVISIRETIKVRQHIACFHRLGVKTGILVILLVLQSLVVSECQ